MRIKFTEEDWSQLATMASEIEPKGHHSNYCVALYKVAAERAGFNPKFMTNLGRKYNPMGFRVTDNFEKRLLAYIKDDMGKEVHPLAWVNCSPSTYKQEELQDDEVEVDLIRCFE